MQEYVRRYTRQYGTEFEVTVFADGVDILEDYRAVYDIIFLDVEMKHLDGMTTAERIRQMDADVILIFITNMAQYAIKGYAVGALDYVLKPVPLTLPFRSSCSRPLPGWKSGQSTTSLCRWRAGCGGWTPQASIIWKARVTGCTFTPTRAIFPPPVPLKAFEEKAGRLPLCPLQQRLPCQSGTGAGSCGRAPCRWAPASCRSAPPQAQELFAALTDYIGGERLMTALPDIPRLYTAPGRVSGSAAGHTRH